MGLLSLLPQSHIASLLLPLVPQSHIASLLLPLAPQSHIASLLLPSTGNCFLQMCFTLLLGDKSLRQDLWLSWLHIPWHWQVVWVGLVPIGAHWATLALSLSHLGIAEQGAGHLFGLMSPPVPSFKSLPFWELLRVRGEIILKENGAIILLFRKVFWEWERREGRSLLEAFPVPGTSWIVIKS